MQSQCSVSAVTEDAEAMLILLSDWSMTQAAASQQEERGKASRKERLKEDRVEHRIMSLL